MAHAKEPTNHREPVPAAPAPAAATAIDGMAVGREEARRYMPNNVRLWAAVAFSPDAEVSLWTRVQASRLIAEAAGEIQPRMPTLPPHYEAASDGHDGTS